MACGVVTPEERCPQGCRRACARVCLCMCARACVCVCGNETRLTYACGQWFP